MDSSQFRQRGCEMVDYIANYLENVSERRVSAAVEPGYLQKLLPKVAPAQGENFEAIMKDVDEKIMPGITHWHHPNFHAYFSSGNSYPSILGDMLADAIGCIGFSWVTSPACTELEMLVLDWFGRMIGLPETFLFSGENSKGGGAFQNSASDCTFLAILAARAQKLKELKALHPFVDESVLLSKLVGYCSKEAHCCADKGSMLAMVKLHPLDPDENLSVRGATLIQAMEEDRARGLVPFFVSASLGTTSTVAFDNLAEIGPICKEANVWLHVDAAYAGNAFICPEFKHYLKGIENVCSFATNPNKWLLTNFDCSSFWVQDRDKLTQSMVVDALILQHDNSDKTIDYRHWGIPLSRRFRALKLWFVIRTYGVEGLQRYIRNHCRLAKRFENWVLQDDRFEICNQVQMGLVCFRLKGSDELNAKFLATINASGKLFMVPTNVRGKYIIRFCVCAETSSDSHIDFAWQTIRHFADDLLAQQRLSRPVQTLATDNVTQVEQKFDGKQVIYDIANLLQQSHLSESPEESSDLSQLILRRDAQLTKKSSQKRFSFVDNLQEIQKINGH